MSSAEGLNTASTGSMSSKGTASTGVSAVSYPEILGVWRVSAVQNPEILLVLAVYTPEILPALVSTPGLPTKVISPTSTRGTVCEFSAKKRDEIVQEVRRRSKYNSYSRVYCAYSENFVTASTQKYEQDPQILQVQAVFKSIEPLNASSTGSIHKY